MTTLQEIIAAVKTLNAADRLRLVDAVWDDASPESWPGPSQAWIEEVQSARPTMTPVGCPPLPGK